MTAIAKKPEADKATEEAAAARAAIAEADAAYREDIAKAAEKRDKALTKIGKDNIAEIAWNETKSGEDPSYKDCAIDHRSKLDAIVVAVRTTGNAGVVGLEAFEARVAELLAERGEAPAAETKTEAAAADKKAADKK